MPKLKDIVKPSDFFTNRPFGGSPLDNFEKEVVAKNVVVICLKNGDAWFEFTFENYKAHLAPRTDFSGEEGVLNELAERHHILDQKGGSYSVNELFFRVLAKFIKVD